MRDRGRLESEKCSAIALSRTLRRLFESIKGAESVGVVHLIVQSYLEPKRRGHLSNERHLRYEPRDWIAEFELHEGGASYTTSIGIRPWRDGGREDQDASTLGCLSEAQVSLCLRSVAKWALAIPRRMHFEWVWDGKTVWIVQADMADDGLGKNPHAFRPADIASVEAADLQCFTLATEGQIAQYPKLHNVSIYRELGYVMPPFYVAADPQLLHDVAAGRPPGLLLADLERLTTRPFILRTDGSHIPVDRREMLPRSDELRSAVAAERWLGAFALRIKELGLEAGDLCLIGHHFIPAAASAWARAEPGKRTVRIESLWGLPEGLYWFSHDTFEVDTLSGTPSGPDVKYSYSQRLRYKGTFIAADSAGRWVPFQTAVPYDWRRSIERESWIREIAFATRRIAERERYPVSVMWLVGNDGRCSPHRVLPWFHSRSELEELPRAAPRQKFSSSPYLTVRTAEDWATFKKKVQAGSRFERVVVQPAEVELIRDQKFVGELADFVARHQIVVQLAGGILSHAFYVLQRAGAQVECVDLFGASQDVLDFNKVVRDRVPQQIEGRGESVEVVRLTGDALLAGLKQKLVEEAFEVLDAKGGEEIIGELADVREVLGAIALALGSNMRAVEAERRSKVRRRGAFREGLVLKKTTTPHSLSPSASGGEMSPLALPGGHIRTISDPAGIPTNPPYRRPDLRVVEGEIEKLLTFEGGINRGEPINQSVRFELPLGQKMARELLLSIELTRSGAIIRGNVRLSLLPKQLSLRQDE
jgi:predicted house-cleaning noncanonical NTP pyrophosphatase (MazG superfamily)